MKEKGVALIMTLWILVILAVIAMEFSNLVRIEAEVALNFKEDTQAYYLAKAGIIRAIGLLKEDANEYDSLDEPWRDMFKENIGDGSYKISIVDKESKLNINEATYGILMGFEEMEEEVANAILDWRDIDEEPRENGAESSYYQGLDEPYNSKNLLFDAIRELQLIKGVNDNLFSKLKDYITVNGKININFAPQETLEALMVGLGIDRDEAREISGIIAQYRRGASTLPPFKNIEELKAKIPRVSDEVYKRLKEEITVMGRININTAKRGVLVAFFRGLEVPEEIADEIIAHRQTSPFTNANELQNLPSVVSSNVYTKIRDYLGVGSNYFSVESIGELGNSPIKGRIRAVVKREKDEEENWKITILNWSDHKGD